jgi:hypothetical protein
MNISILFTIFSIVTADLAWYNRMHNNVSFHVIRREARVHYTNYRRLVRRLTRQDKMIMKKTLDGENSWTL